MHLSLIRVIRVTLKTLHISLIIMPRKFLLSQMRGTQEFFFSPVSKSLVNGDGKFIVRLIKKKKKETLKMMVKLFPELSIIYLYN